MITIHKGFWTRETVKQDADRIYLYGDNEKRFGKGGQACIRGLPNAIGIATKKAPTMDWHAFWSDGEYERNCRIIDEDFAKIPADKDVVISENGLGTGLARLDKVAPKTYRYLLKKIKELEQKHEN
jgi:hypothetical protein